jgi:hypothetical protein
MSEIIVDLVAALDLVILERLEGGVLSRLGGTSPPAWFAGNLHDVHPQKSVTLLEAFPVLDAFVADAEVFWEREGDGRLDAEPCVMTFSSGDHLALATVAIKTNGRKFLLLQPIAGFADRQHVLQRARNRALEHEQVVKTIDLARHPLQRLEQLVTELNATELEESQRKLFDQITRQLEALRMRVDELPQLPKAATPKRAR